MEPSDDNFFSWVESVLDADYSQEFLNEADMAPTPGQRAGELFQRLDSLPSRLDNCLMTNPDQAPSLIHNFPSPFGRDSRVEVSDTDAGHADAHISFAEYQKSTPTSSNSNSMQNFGESNHCIINSDQDLKKSALREIFLRGIFIPRSSRVSVEKLPVYHSLHMDRIEMGMPDSLIQENMFLLAEAIITRNTLRQTL